MKKHLYFSLCIIAFFISFSLSAQILPIGGGSTGGSILNGILNPLDTSLNLNRLEVDELKVDELSVLDGELWLGQGLEVLGDGKFNGNVLIDGALKIGEKLVVTGAVTMEEITTPIIRVERTITNELEAQIVNTSDAIAKNINASERLVVEGAATLNTVNAVAIESQRSISNSLESNSAIIQDNLQVGGDIVMTTLANASKSTVLTLEEGTGRLTGVELDVLLEEVNPCIQNPDGSFVEQPAKWQTSNEKLFTNECAPNVKVGIGVDPIALTEKLQVNGNQVTNGNLTIGQFQADNNYKLSVNNGNAIIKGQGNFNNTATLFLGDNNHAISSEKSFGLKFRNYDNTTGSASDMMVIKEDGKVGIGTNEPEEKLDVSGGDVLVRGLNNFQIPTNDSAKVYLGDLNHSIKAQRGLGISLSTFGAQDEFVIREGSALVGIGITEPQAKLHIVGSYGENLFLIENNEGERRMMVQEDGRVFARGVTVTMNNFPDYVFNEQYTLMPIDELENYINENHHLPGMPTALEVEENGADLNELNRILVEKVEELTLRIIELNKKVELLSK